MVEKIDLGFLFLSKTTQPLSDWNDTLKREGTRSKGKGHAQKGRDTPGIGQSCKMTSICSLCKLNLEGLRSKKFLLLFLKSDCYLSHVKILEKLNFDFRTIDDYGDSILHFFSRSDNFSEELLNHLLKNVRVRAVINVRNNDWMTPILLLCKSKKLNNNFELVKILLEKGATLMEDIHPLELICAKPFQHNFKDFVTLVIKNTSEHCLSEGINPFSTLCIHHGQKDFFEHFKCLVDMIGAPVSILYDLTIYSSGLPIDKCLEYLKEKEFEMDYGYDKNQNPPISRMLDNQNFGPSFMNCLQFFVKNMPYELKNKLDCDKKGAIHFLCSNQSKFFDHSEAFKLLIENGFHQDLQDGNGNYPMHYLLQNFFRFDMQKTFNMIKHQIQLKNDLGNYPFHSLCQTSIDNEWIRLLRDEKFNLNSKNIFGETGFDLLRGKRIKRFVNLGGSEDVLLNKSLEREKGRIETDDVEKNPKIRKIY